MDKKLLMSHDGGLWSNISGIDLALTKDEPALFERHIRKLSKSLHPSCRDCRFCSFAKEKMTVFDVRIGVTCGAEIIQCPELTTKSDPMWRKFPASSAQPSADEFLNEYIGQFSLESYEFEEPPLPKKFVSRDTPITKDEAW